MIKFGAAAWVLIIVLIAAQLWHYLPLMPERVAMHFDGSGYGDGFASKQWAAIGIVVITTGLSIIAVPVLLCLKFTGASRAGNLVRAVVFTILLSIFVFILLTNQLLFSANLKSPPEINVGLIVLMISGFIVADGILIILIALRLNKKNTAMPDNNPGETIEAGSDAVRYPEREFAIMPLRARSYVLGGVLLGAAAGCGTAGLLKMHSSSGVHWVLLMVGLIFFVAGAITMLLTLNGGRIRFVINDKGIEVKHSMYGGLMKRGTLKGKSARIVDTISERAQRPFWKTNGIGLPGYAEGWFLTRDGKSVLAFVSNENQTVAVDTTAGHSIYFSPQGATDFLEEVKKRF